MSFEMPKRYGSLDEALAAVFGQGARVAQADRVFGGDINQAYRLALTDGSQVFLKANRKECMPFFTAEAMGLAAIASTGAIGTPQVLCMGEDCGNMGGAFLLMEFLEGRSRVPDFWEAFAHQLAGMHQAGTGAFVTGGAFGFLQDNYIGAGAQKNTACNRWVDFFRECRLKPQLQKASVHLGREDMRRAEKLLERLGDILVEPGHPSLLHGDLWAGNFITGKDGRAWLIDPAAYVGHAEADIAMTELFGGFPQRFYDAYREAGGMQEGYGRRRGLYNLYHLLNHLNLFGRAYLGAVKEGLRQLLPDPY